MEQYQQLLRKVLQDGTYRPDRTDTGTFSVFGHQSRYDLSEGFPLVTTKKMFTRGMIEELLWFVRGSTDVRELQERGVHFWDSWVLPDGTIGEGYGKQMRSIEYYKEVTPMLFPHHGELGNAVVAPAVACDYSNDNNSTGIRVGTVIDTTYAGKVRLISAERNSGGRVYWVGQFENTGSIVDIPYGAVLNGKIKDPHHRGVSGTGYYGNHDKEDKHLQLLLTAWREMLRRCYNENSNTYHTHGGRGVFVAPEWHCFATFQDEVKKVPNWELKVEWPNDYVLDKDVLRASNCYHRDTVKWACADEQKRNTTQTRYFSAVNPLSKDAEHFPSIGAMRDKYGVNVSAVHRCLNGKLRTHHGWSGFTYMVHDGGKVLRYRKIDQLKETIARLKHQPESRRHVISLWNAHDIQDMKLPCCHGNMIQFYVADGKLSCQMYQRSGDVFLGVPVNIASYALLTMMIAQVTNLQVGEFIHTIGDAHLYSNHIEQAELQLSRSPNPLPQMLIDPTVTDIDDFTYDDFTLANYSPHPHIAGKVAV